MLQQHDYAHYNGYDDLSKNEKIQFYKKLINDLLMLGYKGEQLTFIPNPNYESGVKKIREDGDKSKDDLAKKRLKQLESKRENYSRK